MAVWRDDDPEVFTATIDAAAEQLGVQPIAVEKDYRVCEVLRAIIAAHGDEVVFKGGTSLEKMRVIQPITLTSLPPPAFRRNSSGSAITSDSVGRDVTVPPGYQGWWSASSRYQSRVHCVGPCKPGVASRTCNPDGHNPAHMLT